MWLIDENLNVRLYQVLSELGITAHSVSYAGLKGLKNGELLAAAQRMAYSTILTRDNLYAQESGFLGGSYPEIGIVVIEVRVPQDTFLVELSAVSTASNLINP